MASLGKLGSEISTILFVLSLPVALVLSNYNAGKTGFCVYHKRFPNLLLTTSFIFRFVIKYLLVSAVV